MNKSTICRISSRYRQTINVERKPGTGQSRKSTARQDNQSVKILKVDPGKTVVDLSNYANEQLVVSGCMAAKIKRVKIISQKTSQEATYKEG